MKKLKTEITGKFPFLLDDLRWQFEGLKEAIAQIASAFGNKVILWGLVSDDDGNLSSGAVFVNGEIFKFDASSSVTAGNLVLKISETFDSNGLKYFPARVEGDRLQDTYAIRKLVSKSYTPLPTTLPVDEFLFSEFTRIADFNDNSSSIQSINTELYDLSVKVNETKLQEVTKPIGVWNIGNTHIKEVDFSDYANNEQDTVNFAENIRGIDIIIFDDSGSPHKLEHHLLGATLNAYYNASSDKFVFTNTNLGGGFDSFSNDTINRGYITIRYKLEWYTGPEH